MSEEWISGNEDAFDWHGDAVDDDEYFEVMGELGVSSGEDAENLFDAVFGDDSEGMQSWLDDWASEGDED
jgi:hypothetical protein